MRTERLKTYLAYTLLIASFMVLASSAKAQERRVSPVEEVELPNVKSPCPKPFPLTLTATTANVVSADFLPGFLNPPPPVVGFNIPVSDRKFLHTFQWRRPGRCCEITRAVLTVKMKSNLGGNRRKAPTRAMMALLSCTWGMWCCPTRRPSIVPPPSRYSIAFQRPLIPFNRGSLLPSSGL